MATILRADGTQQEIQPANGVSFTLAELQAVVGAGAPPDGHLIEIVPTRDDRLMVINEEGKIYHLPRNEQATEIAALATSADLAKVKLALGEAAILIGYDLEGEEPDYIAGDALVCTEDEVQ